MTRGKCVQEGTEIFVIYTSSRENLPEVVSLWWPVNQNRSIEAHNLVGHEVTAAHSGDPFRIAPEDPAFWSLKNYTAFVDGRAEAKKIATYPVPAPKVRKGIQTRWYQGRWQKLLRSGWIDC